MFPNPLENGMPRFLPMLAKLPAGSAELNSCFQNGISQLSGTLENRQNFQSFNWSPSLKKELNTMSFNLDDLQADWHKGLGPGIAMSRDRDAVTRSKRLHSEIDEYGGLGFNLGRLDTQRLQTPTPSVPKDYASFLQFLVRYSLILREWMTQNCNLYQITWALYLEILATNQNASYPEQWYQRHGPFIIWKLIITAKQFFEQRRTHETLPMQGVVYITPDPTRFAQDIIRNASTLVAVEELPPAFQAVIRQHVPVHLPPAPSPAAARPSSAPAMGRSPPTPAAPSQTSRANRRQNQQQQQPIEHRNPTPNAQLVQFFGNLQQDPQINAHYKRTVNLCQAVGTTLSEVLTSLGLDENDCGNYYLRGVCRRNFCRNSHGTKPLTADGLQAFLNRLNPALPNLRGRAPPQRA
eukprot:Sro2145_g316340.2  (409) ;mRNA; f:3189-4415